MQANAASVTSTAVQFAPSYGWQPTIFPNTVMIPTSNCPPIAEHQARFADAQDSAGYICEVAQNVAVVEKQSPAGTVFIPIQRHLSDLCAKFHCRQENNNEYTLGDIYLALKSEAGYVGEQGQFTQLLIYLHQPIKIRRQGAHLVPLEGPDQLEEARFERLFPYHYMGRTYPGYYWMYISLPAFGGYVLNTRGTPGQLLRLFKSG